MSTKRTDPKFESAYKRATLRAAFVSLFWAVISERKKRGGFTLQALAKAIGSTKHEVSRWFNGDPNWTINTVANIAHALDLELTIQARERTTGLIFTPAGVQISQQSKATAIPIQGDIKTSFGWRTEIRGASMTSAKEAA